MFTLAAVSQEAREGTLHFSTPSFSHPLQRTLFSSDVRSTGNCFFFRPLSALRLSPRQLHLVFSPSLLWFSTVLPPLRLDERGLRGRTGALCSLPSTKKSLSQNGRPYLRDSRADAFPTAPPLSPSVQGVREKERR